MQDMQIWSITLHGPAGVISAVDAGESQFVIGTESAADVYTVDGEGVMPRHAWVWIGNAGLQVEDLGGGTLVNGCHINQRVQVEYPASVQVGEITLVIEIKAGQSTAVATTSNALEITMVGASSTRNKPVADANIPWGQAVRSVSESSHQGVERGVDAQKPDAPLTGGYMLVREIARGGMGQIYFGEDPQLERQVAVKVSSVSEAGEDPRFLKEAKVLAQLAHPNIVPIHNIGVDAEGRPFYAMKLVKGRTLQAVLDLIRDGDDAVQKEYSRAKLLTIFRKVCDAMMFAHSKGILHRDLKPENVMVGEYGEVLVMDWGLAKVLGEREESGSAVSRVNDTGDYGMTMEGEVMGTPQYMSPEQATGMVAELDQRSDIYSLGGIFYAILTQRPPIEGATLNEVLTKVKNGVITSMSTNRGGKGTVHAKDTVAMGTEVPEALQAVTLKAMATDRGRRYASVELFAADIERYQNGFATQAEEAGAWKRTKLWVGRNRVLAGSALAMLLIVSAFSVRVVLEGRKASAALERLRSSAPTFALRAEDALQNGNFHDALAAASNAVDLQPEIAEYHRIRGNVLQVMVRWPEAVSEYRLAHGDAQAEVNLKLTETLIERTEKDAGDKEARVALFEALNAQGRQYEAMEFGKTLGDFWKERNRDLNALSSLIKQLESKLIPVPGTKVLMSRTEMTVGEWKLFLKAEGLPEWQQPNTHWTQTDEHPVVNVSWDRAKEFCAWLSAKTGKSWRLPTSKEWQAAAGNTLYPWGEYFPPNRDDGNYAIEPNGKHDNSRVGIDGVKGTTPVGSFKPNALGFSDLGGNVWEWVADTPGCGLGGGWDIRAGRGVIVDWTSASKILNKPSLICDSIGLRLVCGSGL
jgi:serine/threonine protein kinase